VQGPGIFSEKLCEIEELTTGASGDASAISPGASAHFDMMVERRMAPPRRPVPAALDSSAAS
jgi:hypothetical protein